MQNLKIRVNDEAESKEVQELFFKLGYGFEGNKVKETQEFEYTGVFYLFAYGNDCDLTYSTDRELFNSKLLHKEITLPELRAMVKPMKEWLNTKTLEYKRAHTKPDGEWLEIPEDMNFAYKDDMCIHFTKLEMGYRDAELIWQRPTQPEALPFIDDEPQSLNNQYAEIEQVRQQTIEATLAERQSTYGNFEDVAFVTESIMSVLAKARASGWNDLPHTHRMALYMIASKMARIVNGDFNHLDSWHDIGGYAKLVEKLIDGE